MCYNDSINYNFYYMSGNPNIFTPVDDANAHWHPDNEEKTMALRPNLAIPKQKEAPLADVQESDIDALADGLGGEEQAAIVVGEEDQIAFGGAALKVREADRVSAEQREIVRKRIDMLSAEDEKRKAATRERIDKKFDADEAKIKSIDDAISEAIEGLKL